MKRNAWHPALAAALAGAAFAAAAQDPSPQDLEQRILILERKLEIQAEEAQAKARDAANPGAGEKGFGLRSADGAFELKFKALVQFDYRSFRDDAGASNDGFIFRRIRPGFEGSAGPLAGFRLTPEFAGNNATIVDAYVDLKFSPAATVRAGKLKGPVALERLQPGGAIAFIERGFPTELAPNRDLGVQLQGDLLAGTVSYAVGVFNGTADGRDAATSDVDAGKELAARLFFEPFRNEPGFFQGLGFGIAGSRGSKITTAATDTTTNSKPQYRTPGQNVFFAYDPGVVADGDHVRLSPQLYFYKGSFGLLAEHIRSEQELREATTDAAIENTAWQVSAGYVLTGEDASFRGVTRPASPYIPGGDGWGAVEVLARYGVLDIDDDVFPNGFVSGTAASQSEAKAWTVGVNWYLTPAVKLVGNYSHTRFEAPVAANERDDEKAMFARLQLSY